MPNTNITESNEALHIYILHYLRRRGFSRAAEGLSLDANLADLDHRLSHTSQAPSGYLEDWWSVFWFKLHDLEPPPHRSASSSHVNSPPETVRGLSRSFDGYESAVSQQDQEPGRRRDVQLSNGTDPRLQNFSQRSDPQQQRLGRHEMDWTPSDQPGKSRGPSRFQAPGMQQALSMPSLRNASERHMQLFPIEEDAEGNKGNYSDPPRMAPRARTPERTHGAILTPPTSGDSFTQRSAMTPIELRSLSPPGAPLLRRSYTSPEQPTQRRSPRTPNATRAAAYSSMAEDAQNQITKQIHALESAAAHSASAIRSSAALLGLSAQDQAHAKSEQQQRVNASLDQLDMLHKLRAKVSLGQHMNDEQQRAEEAENAQSLLLTNELLPSEFGEYTYAPGPSDDGRPSRSETGELARTWPPASNRQQYAPRLSSEGEASARKQTKRKAPEQERVAAEFSYANAWQQQEGGTTSLRQGTNGGTQYSSSYGATTNSRLPTTQSESERFPDLSFTASNSLTYATSADMSRSSRTVAGSDVYLHSQAGHRRRESPPPYHPRLIQSTSNREHANHSQAPADLRRSFSSPHNPPTGDNRSYNPDFKEMFERIGRPAVEQGRDGGQW